MKEYIERAAVHDLVKSLPEYHMFNYDRTESRRGISPDDVDFGVDKIPAADVAPVRHGRWSSNGIALVCSECGRAFGIVEMFAHYCPWCGSRMDKEGDLG